MTQTHEQLVSREGLVSDLVGSGQADCMAWRNPGHLFRDIMKFDLDAYEIVPPDAGKILFMHEHLGIVYSAVDALIKGGKISPGDKLSTDALVNMLIASDYYKKWLNSDEVFLAHSAVRYKLTRSVELLLGTHGLQLRRVAPGQFLVPDLLPQVSGDCVLSLPLYRTPPQGSSTPAI